MLRDVGVRKSGRERQGSECKYLDFAVVLADDQMPIVATEPGNLGGSGRGGMRVDIEEINSIVDLNLVVSDAGLSNHGAIGGEIHLVHLGRVVNSCLEAPAAGQTDEE